MIADAPLAVAEAEQEGPLSKAAAFLQSAQASAADGLTWQEFGELLVAMLRMLVGSYDHVVSLDGVAKKALVIESAGQLFDLLADKCVPLVAWPAWMLCRPAIRMLVLALSSGAIEQLLKMVRGRGI